MLNFQIFPKDFEMIGRWPQEKKGPFSTSLNPIYKHLIGPPTLITRLMSLVGLINIC